MISIPCMRKSYTVTDELKDFAWYCFTVGNRLEEIDLKGFSYDIRRTNAEEELINLKRFKVSESNPTYSVKDGILFSKNGETLMIYPNGRDDTEYTTPTGVKTLAYHSFAGNKKLKKVIVSEGVTTIEECALFSCTYLEYLSLPSTLLKIEAAAFQHNYALKTMVSLAKNPPVLYDNFVMYDAGFNEILVPAGSVDAYKTANVWKEFADKIKAIE